MIVDDRDADLDKKNEVESDAVVEKTKDVEESDCLLGEASTGSSSSSSSHSPAEGPHTVSGHAGLQIAQLGFGAKKLRDDHVDLDAAGSIKVVVGDGGNQGARVDFGAKKLQNDQIDSDEDDHVDLDAASSIKVVVGDGGNQGARVDFGAKKLQNDQIDSDEDDHVDLDAAGSIKVVVGDGGDQNAQLEFDIENRQTTETSDSESEQEGTVYWFIGPSRNGEGSHSSDSGHRSHSSDSGHRSHSSDTGRLSEDDESVNTVYTMVTLPTADSPPPLPSILSRISRVVPPPSPSGSPPSAPVLTNSNSTPPPQPTSSPPQPTPPPPQPTPPSQPTPQLQQLNQQQVPPPPVVAPAAVVPAHQRPRQLRPPQQLPQQGLPQAALGAPVVHQITLQFGPNSNVVRSNRPNRWLLVPDGPPARGTYAQCNFTFWLTSLNNRNPHPFQPNVPDELLALELAARAVAKASSYRYQIHVMYDCPRQRLGQAPDFLLYFTDMDGGVGPFSGTYELQAQRRGYHSVGYNSARPQIRQIEIFHATAPSPNPFSWYPRQATTQDIRIQHVADYLNPLVGRTGGRNPREQLWSFNLPKCEGSVWATRSHGQWWQPLINDYTVHIDYECAGFWAPNLRFRFYNERDVKLIEMVSEFRPHVAGDVIEHSGLDVIGLDKLAKKIGTLHNQGNYNRPNIGSESIARIYIEILHS